MRSFTLPRSGNQGFQEAAEYIPDGIIRLCSDADHRPVISHYDPTEFEPTDLIAGHSLFTNQKVELQCYRFRIWVTPWTEDELRELANAW